MEYARRERVDLGGVPLDLYLDRAARIDDPALEAVFPGKPVDERAEADSLDDAMNGEMFQDLMLFSQSIQSPSPSPVRHEIWKTGASRLTAATPSRKRDTLKSM